MTAAKTRQKVKTVSLHYKRRRADAMAHALEIRFLDLNDDRSRAAWLSDAEFPAWTAGFEVRRARTRFHYKVVSVSR